MDNVLTVALGKTLDKKIKGITLEPGVYPIDQTITLRVQGTVARAPDTESKPTIKIPLLVTMALLLEKSGIQRENSLRLLTDAMKEAMLVELDGDGEPVEAEGYIAQRLKDIATVQQSISDAISSLPKIPRKGRTTVTATINEIKQA